MSAALAHGQQLYFHQIATGFNNPIGIDHHQPTNTVIASVNYATGNPVALERILPNGSHVAFSTLSGVTDEVKIATIRPGAVNPGGFTVGELYVGNGQDGEIVKISPNGSTITDPWVSLPGSGNGLMRGSLYHDRTGVFGGDLIVCTTTGEVWRVTSAGTTSATPLASLGTHLEGLCTIPNNVAQYGPLAGKILCGAEQQGRLYTVDVFGTSAFHTLGVDIEDIDIIPSGQHFYGVNFGTGKILGVAASAFAAVAGDILLTQETHTGSGLFRLHWNAGTTTLETTQFGIASGSATIGQWEHVTFSHGGINPLPELVTGINKDLQNATGVRADEVIITVLGTYDASDVKSHYDGGFPTFTVTNSAGQTHFSWSGMNVPNNAVVHVGVELFGPSIKFMAITWKSSGVTVGCARQVNSLYGTHSSGTHQVEYANDVLSCASTTLYAGDLSVEYYDVAPPLAELNPTGNRTPIQVDFIPAGPTQISAGGSTAVQVPDPPPTAQYAVLVFKVSTDPQLNPPDLTLDFVLLPLDPPTPVAGPVTYCTPVAPGTTNGCIPTVGGTANPNVSHSNTCVLTVSSVEGQKTGIVFYGLAAHNIPWCSSGGGSFLCVKAPTQRTQAQSSGGTAGACNGSLVLDWNAFQTSHAGALGQPWSAGNDAFVQGWFRDPPACKTTFLSEALQLTYQP